MLIRHIILKLVTVKLNLKWEKLVFALLKPHFGILRHYFAKLAPQQLLYGMVQVNHALLALLVHLMMLFLVIVLMWYALKEPSITQQLNNVPKYNVLRQSRSLIRQQGSVKHASMVPFLIV